MQLKLPHLDVITLIEGKLTLLALPPTMQLAKSLILRGVKDLLILDKDAKESPQRTDNQIRIKYKRQKDTYTNNCEIAILHKSTALILRKKYKFSKFSHILVPIGIPLFMASFGLLRYCPRGDISLIGTTRIPIDNTTKKYIVLKVNTRPTENRRQYGPAGLSAHEILRQLSDLELVVLRNIPKIMLGEHTGDIDVLVSKAAVNNLIARLEAAIGTFPIDVYTEDGSGRYTYNGVPYYANKIATRILVSAEINNSGIRVPSPLWQYISYCYHLLFHNKCAPNVIEPIEINSRTFTNQDNYIELCRLATLAEQPVPATFDDIEGLLKTHDAMPSLDLISFYSKRNLFLKKRYLDQTSIPPGLATFFVRDFGQGRDAIDLIRTSIQSHFKILAEGPLSEEQRLSVMTGVRGGNWVDPQAPGGLAEPIYWFVCWDEHPKAPSRRVQKKHPHVDNEHIRLKDAIRNEIGGGGKKVRAVVHSSDNSSEALDHLEHLGLLDEPKISEKLDSAT